MLLTDRLLRSVSAERASATGGASDMALVGGTPATFDMALPDHAVRPSSVTSQAAPQDGSAPFQGSGDQRPFFTGVSALPLLSGGLSTGPVASAAPASIAIQPAPVAQILTPLPLGSGSAPPALAGAADTIGSSAAALASAIGDLTALLRAETPAAAPHLDQLQTQLQSLGAQAQALAGGAAPHPTAFPIAPLDGALTTASLAAATLASGTGSVVGGTIHAVLDAASDSAVPLVDGLVGMGGTVAELATDMVTDIATATGEAAGSTLDQVGDTVAATLTIVPPALDTVTTEAGHLITAVTDQLAPPVSGVIDGAVAGVSQTIGAVTETAATLTQTITGTVADTVSPVVDGAVGTAVDLTQSVTGGLVAAVASVTAPPVEADAPFGGSDPPGGMATLHELLSGEEAYELVDSVADTVVFASAGVIDPVEEAIAPLETLVTAPIETLLSPDDDDHHGLLGGLGLGFDHG